MHNVQHMPAKKQTDFVVVVLLFMSSVDAHAFIFRLDWSYAACSSVRNRLGKGGG